MWIFALLVCIWVILVSWIMFNPPKAFVDGERFLVTAVLTVVMVLFGASVGQAIAKATGGMIPDYANGVREGYITKLSKKGVIWKTWEAEMQIGSGELSALQAPFAFSIKDDEMADNMRKNLSKKVRLEYRQWVLMPYQIGESNYEATGLTPHPAEKK